MNSFEANAKRVEATMGKAVLAFNTGGISAEEYSKTIQGCQNELDAMAAGFSSMGAATSRAQSILLGMENETDKYNRKLKELNNLKQIGALKEHEYAKAVAHTTAEYQKSLPSSGAVATNTDKLGLQFANNLPIVNRFSGLMAGVGTPIGLAAAALVGAGVAVKIFHDAFDFGSKVVAAGLKRIEEAANAAEQIGLPTDEFQRLDFIFGRADISQEKMIGGFQKMNKAISDGMAGNKSAQKLFRDLDVDLDKLASSTPDKAFRTLANAIIALESPFDRTRFAMELFGKGGGEFLRVLQEGSRGLEELGKRADSLRLTTPEIDVRHIKEAQDALFDLNKAFEGLGNVLTRHVAPVLTPVVNDLIRLIEAPQEAITDMAGRLDEVAAAIGRSNSPWDLAFNLSSVYFESVSEKAALASLPLR